MVTVKETTERSLDTADDIAAFLASRYEASAAATRFKPGEVLRIANRAGIPPTFGVGDVAVMLFDVPVSPWSHVLMLNSDGAEIVVQVATDNLAQREVPE